jgi:hypothetical protein
VCRSKRESEWLVELIAGVLIKFVILESGGDNESKKCEEKKSERDENAVADGSKAAIRPAW